MTCTIVARVPVASRVVVPSICHTAFGAGCTNRRPRCGRFRGAGVIWPRSSRMRWIVARDGTSPRSGTGPPVGWTPVAAMSSSRHRMLCAPWSQPSSASSLRARTTASPTYAGVLVGRVRGARERGVSPALPCSRNRSSLR